MTEKTCGGALMLPLQGYSVTTVFRIPGEHTLELYSGIEGNNVRHVTPLLTDRLVDRLDARRTSPDISRRRTLYQKSSQYLKRLRRILGYGASAQFVLFGIRGNWASQFPLKSEPFMNCPG